MVVGHLHSLWHSRLIFVNFMQFTALLPCRQYRVINPMLPTTAAVTAEKLPRDSATPFFLLPGGHPTLTYLALNQPYDMQRSLEYQQVDANQPLTDRQGIEHYEYEQLPSKPSF